MRNPRGCAKYTEFNSTTILLEEVERLESSLDKERHLHQIMASKVIQQKFRDSIYRKPFENLYRWRQYENGCQQLWQRIAIYKKNYFLISVFHKIVLPIPHVLNRFERKIIARGGTIMKAQPLNINVGVQFTISSSIYEILCRLFCIVSEK